MSSSTTPAKATQKATTVGSTQTVVVKRESFASKLASIFGGKVEHYDSSKPGLNATEANFPMSIEKATGNEKLLLLAFENGYLDPFSNLPTERGNRGTKDNPVLIESFTDERAIACACEQSQNYLRFTIVHKDEPKRCQCGHWMQLVVAPRFWQDIPREDLLEIPFFKELETEGKLDKFMETGKLDEGHHHH